MSSREPVGATMKALTRSGTGRARKDVAFTYTTARGLNSGPLIPFFSLLPARAALPDFLLAAGRSDPGTGFGHPQTTHAHAAAPFAVLDRAAHGAGWLLECLRSNSAFGPLPIGPVTAAGGWHAVLDCRYHTGRSHREETAAGPLHASERA